MAQNQESQEDPAMSSVKETLDLIREGIGQTPTPSIEELRSLITPITIGLTQPMPVAFEGTRMFRVRALADKPKHVQNVGAPPSGVAPRGRINEEETSVLYLSDTPRTALAEADIEEGDYCISEWRVDCPKLGLVNGGITKQLLADHFSQAISDLPAPEPTEQDHLVMELFRDVFTLDVGDDIGCYAWSIAAGRASGFNHLSGLEEKTEKDGITMIKGEMPFSALVFPSVRLDRLSLNYVINHQGMEHVSLQNVQWARRISGGRARSLDIATEWSDDGKFHWKGRPGRFVLKGGEKAKLTKVGPDEWDFETENGTMPWYS